MKEESIRAEQHNVSTETSNKMESEKEYYVNIDGEDVKVDVKSDEEYSCLLNCLEGYYVYGIGRDDEDDDNDLEVERED